MSKIVGYRKFTSKKGNPTCLVSLLCAYNNNETKYGAVGHRVEEIFVPEDCHDLFVPSVIGKDANVSYYQSNGRFYVDSITIK